MVKPQRKIRYTIAILLSGMLLVYLVVASIGRNNPNSLASRLEWFVQKHAINPVEQIVFGTTSKMAGSQTDEIQRALLRFDFNSDNYRLYSTLIAKAAYKEKIDPHLIRAVIIIGSRFDPNYESSRRKGLMQIDKSTIKAEKIANPFNPRINIQAGAKRLSMLLQQTEGNKEAALASYWSNRSPTSPPAKDPETARFVKSVIEAYKLLQGV